MTTAGSTLRNLRRDIRTRYLAEGIYVLHVFQKKSRKTSALDLDLARSRYAAILRARREG